MNKGFFAAALGIVLGAMVLIFLNQASAPPAATTIAATSTTTTSPGDTASPDGNAGSNAGGSSAASGSVNTPATPARPANTPKPVTPPSGPKPVQPDAPKPTVTVPPKPAETPKPVVTPPKPVEQPKPVTPPKPVETPKPVTPPKPVEKPAEPVVAKKGVLTLRNIGVHFKGNGMVLRVEADGPFNYKSFVLPSPDRYVVDLNGNWSGMRAPSVPSNNIIKNVRAGKQAGGPRLVLDLHRTLKSHNVVRVSPTVVEFRIE